MSLSLVKADLAHVPLIAAMHRICFTEYWDAPAVADILTMPGSFGWVAQEPAADAAAPPRPAGLILCRVAADEAEVLTIAVLPPYRRRGVGRMLLDAALDTAGRAGAEAMFLEAAANNTAALALYSSVGFSQVGLRPRYYGGVIDALILRRDL